MVASVSPSCTSTEDHKASSSSFNQQAMVFAAAVTAAVISQAFIFIIFLKLYYDIICKSRAGETIPRLCNYKSDTVKRDYLCIYSVSNSCIRL